MRSWLFSVFVSQKLQANGALPLLDLEAQVRLFKLDHSRPRISSIAIRVQILTMRRL